MRKLDRYIIGEVFGPLALGLSVFTFILLIDVLFDVAEIVVRRDVPLLLVGELVGLSLPHILVLTIPMAYLFAILLAVGRLSADSELVALRASGVSLFSLYRPLTALSLVLASLNLLLMLYALPWGNSRKESLETQIIARSGLHAIEPRQFYEELEDYVLYVHERSPEGQLRGVFLSEAVPRRESQVIIAEAGTIQINAQTKQASVTLLNGYTDSTENLERPQATYEHAGFVETVLRLGENVDRAQSISSTRDPRSLTLPELFDLHGSAATAERRREALVEIHKKFSIPAACLVFGLFGVPLGFNSGRGGRSSGFALSTLIIIAYYVVMSNGEDAATAGKLPPWVAMWGPNLLFLVLGAFLLARRNRDKSLLLGNLDRFVRERLWGRLRVRRRLRQRRKIQRTRQRLTRTAEAQRRQGAVVLRLPRPRLFLPNLLDRYIVLTFTKVFGVVVLAVMAVYIVADLTELADEILKNDGATASVVFDYYRYLSLQIFYQMAPMVVLLTTLTTFALLSRSNEITAAKALGLSLFRLTLPAVVAAGFVAFFSAFLEYSVLPETNTRVAELKDVIRGRENARTYRRADRQWLFGRSGNHDYIYNYLYFDQRRQSLQRLQVFRFDREHHLTGRLYAASATYRGSSWLARGVWTREFSGGAVTHFEEHAGAVPIDLPESPSFFDTEIRSPDQMNFTQLWDWLHTLREGGQQAPELEVQLHNKVAMPVVCLVMAVVALPFAFRLGKRGALYGVGLALALGMGFYAIIAFFTTLGEAGALPPPVAAWSPNLLFATFSLYLFLGVRT